MLQVEGEIQAIKKDRLGIRVNDTWFSSFKALSEDFKKGDFIKATYYEKGDFNNIKSIVKVKEFPGEIKTGPKISNDSISSQLLSYSKDLMVAGIENGKPVEFDKIVDLVIQQYKKIKGSL